MKALINIQSELNAPKGQFNKFGGYKYRSCEDILSAVKPLLKANGCTLIISDEVKQIGDRYYIEATAMLRDSEGGEMVVRGLAREADTKKGMDESQITGSASSYARKYALNGLFAIDDTKDADTRSPEENTTPEDKSAKPSKPAKVKEVLTIGSDNYRKVLNALAGGFTLADVKKKYELTADVVIKLNEDAQL